jgi:hypothetical protein
MTREFKKHAKTNDSRHTLLTIFRRRNEQGYQNGGHNRGHPGVSPSEPNAQGGVGFPGNVRRRKLRS